MNRGAQKVKAWRRSQTPPVTQEQMVDRFGMSMISWSRFERGERTPPPKVIQRLDDAGICTLQDWLSPVRSDSSPTAAGELSVTQGSRR